MLKSFLCICGCVGVLVVGASPTLLNISSSEDERALLLSFDGGLDSSATNLNVWSVSGSSVVSARFFNSGRGVRLGLLAPLDRRSVYVVSGKVVVGGQSLMINEKFKREKSLGLPARLVAGVVESPSAASRRSAIVISEVMVVPAVREDGRDLRFVELYNANPYPERLGNFSISGGLEFTFPTGRVLEANARVVVAANAADVEAVYNRKNVEQATVATGFTLPCSLKLQDDLGGVIGKLDLADDVPWIAGINSSGHSLVLARPSYGWTECEAWLRSAMVGGSPGEVEPNSPTSYVGVVINEVLSHSEDSEGFVELFNAGDYACALRECTLEVAGTTNTFTCGRLQVCAAQGVCAIKESQLGFQIGGEGIELILRAPASVGGYVIDALRVPPIELDRSFGRYPDGASVSARLASPTFATENLPRAVPEVILNELMYHPITESKKDEYVEVRNLAATNINLKAWSLAGDIEYSFKKTDIVTAGGYLVVPRTMDNFTNLYPNVKNISTKTYSGALPNGRGVVRLCCELPVWSAKKGSVKNKDVVMEEVVYRDGGAWGDWCDGGGSSLERVEPRAEPHNAGSWAASDESNTCGWKDFSCTAMPKLGIGDANGIICGFYDAGECLIDDVVLKTQDGQNLVLNPSFEVANGWSATGTHEMSGREKGVAYTGDWAYHIRATDKLAMGGNCVLGLMTGKLPLTNPVTISARVKWLGGSPDFVLKARGNWVEVSDSILTTTAMGTPGCENSRQVVAGTPQIADMIHLPILPKAKEDVRVWARMAGSEGVASAQLIWAVQGTKTTNTVAMVRSVGDWWYGVVPGQTSGQLVAFHVVANGANAQGTQVRFPVTCEGLVRFGETDEVRKLTTYRLWVESSEITKWKNQIWDSNVQHPCTFVYGNDRVVYGAGVEYGGSSWHAVNSFTGTPGDASGIFDYKVTFPKDEPVLGDNGLVLAMPGNGGDDNTAVREQFSYSLLRRTGHPYMYRKFVHVRFNGVLQNCLGIHEDTEKPSSDVLDHWYPDGGRLYKMCCWCEYPTNYSRTVTSYEYDQGVKLDHAQYKWVMDDGTIVYPEARLRWNFQPRGVENFECNDYSGIQELLAAVNASPALSDNQLNAYLDASSYAQVLAIERFVMNSDSYGMPTDLNSGHSKGKNMFICKGTKGWELLVWDIDISFWSSASTTYANSIYKKSLDPKVQPLLARPLFLRRYWQALEACATAGLAGSVERTEITQKYTALQEDGVSVSSLSSLNSSIQNRASWTKSEVAKMDTASFKVEFPTGVLATNTATIKGSAPLKVQRICVNDTAVEVTWLTHTNWVYDVALTQLSTPLQVVAEDTTGAVVGSFNGVVQTTKLQQSTVSANRVQSVEQSNRQTLSLVGNVATAPQYCVLTLNTLLSENCVIERCTNLTEGVWVPIDAKVYPQQDGTTQVWIETENIPAAFFRCVK